jgi:hydroxyacylglutathione hydrolase
MFLRFFDEGLAQSSYLIACDRSREAVVIDPRRDIDVYRSAARDHGLTLTHAIETHIHADFVCGSRELAALGARVVAGPGSQLAFDHHEAHDGERIELGDLQLQILHTPGHTPEHISLVARNGDDPVRLFSGDTLFVGAVGRPDLLGVDLTRQLAGQLYDSLFGRVLTLGDEVEVHPGHGAGSLCGAGIGKEPHSTIGRERLFNPMLQQGSRDGFVAAVLADLPDTPPYFSRMKRLNQAGPPVVGLADGVSGPPRIAAADAAAAAERGATLLDIRSAADFGSGHPAGALNIAFGSKVGYWAGWVVAPDHPIVLLGDGVPAQAIEIRRQLLRVGLDTLLGTIEGGFAAWQAAGLPVARIPQIDVRDLRQRVQQGHRLVVLDVRTRREFEGGHVAGALHLPVGDVARLGALSPETEIATICEGGFRSSLAASLLSRAGFPAVVNVTGGMAAYRSLEAPL